MSSKQFVLCNILCTVIIISLVKIYVYVTFSTMPIITNIQSTSLSVIASRKK